MHKSIFVLLFSIFILSTTTTAQEQPYFAPIYIPNLPTSAKLCGERIDLDRTDLYERYDRELTSVAYTHGTTTLIIKRANRYFPEMAPILKKYKVPEDILYLACIESMLNPRAYSPSKAAGIWQFLATTAKEYGLEVNDEVDERYNLEKATTAACKFLNKAYDQFGDWFSAICSYNGGMTRIANSLEFQRVASAEDLYLAEETMRYPFRILAMKTIMEDPGLYGFFLADDQLYQPRQYNIVEVSGPVSDWAEWAEKRGITYSILREENPWIRAKSLKNKTGKTYKVKIPTKESLQRSKAGYQTYNPAWTK